MNRFIRRLAVPLCFALVAGAGVACGGDDNENEGAQGAQSGESKNDIKVGAIFDLSGATADVGTPFSEGIRDFIEWKNANGGVDGHKLALSWQDYGYKVPQAEQLYQQYVSQGAKVFMGWGTGDTEALRPRVNADKVPFMSASLAETLTDPKVTPYNFFPAPSYSQQMRIALQYIADQNQGKGKVEVAVFHHDSPFGTSPLDDGRKFVADKKLDINIKNYPMPATATDYVAQIGQAKSQGAKYVIIQNVAKPAAKLASDIKAQNFSAQIVCLNWCADELFVSLAGGAAEGMIGVMPFTPPAAATGLDDINNFLKTKNTDAAAKGLHYVQGWYTMATMAEGIANALKENEDPSGEDIKTGLEAIDNFTTPVSEPISFSPQSHAGMMSAPLYQVEAGKFKKIHDPINPTV
ncbi:MAG TPA: ABC transporter substrate-binding protein [Acidimicrobiia bacterium]|nr:ABC transporter substrate-binding protein [Acidimicrobiia bacterium]